MHLGLTDRQFGVLTPRQFHLLLDRHQERVEHGKMLTGLIASTVANFSMGAPKKPLMPMDFFGAGKKQRKDTKGDMARTKLFLMAMSKPA